MRIAMFGHKHIFTSDGGVEVVVTELAERMSKDNTVIIYDRGEINKPKRKVQNDNKNLIIRRSPTLSFSFANAQMASFFSTLSCMFGKQDITHVHAEGSCVFLPLLRLTKKNVVVTIHGIDWQRAKWSGFARNYIRFGEKMAAKYADEIIVLSKEIQDYFQKTYGRETKLIGNGVSFERTDETNEIEKFGLSQGGYILYLGRFAPEKRLDLLYEAFSWSEAKKMGYKLVIAGPDNDLDKELPWYKAALADHGVIFTGMATGELKRQLISSTRLFVLPSDLEGMSMALLEALGSGAPVLVSDIEENRQVLHGFGTTFTPGDRTELMRKMDELVEGEYKVNDDQISYIQKNYSWDGIVEKTLDVYQEVIDRKQAKNKRKV